MKRELSTGCELSTASLKKREGEKRNPPLTPYREKGKGKEQDRVSCETSSKTARAHARRRLPCTCSYDEAGAAADEIVGNCFGSAGDLGLWAWYCRHFDRERIVDKAYAYFKHRSWHKTGLPRRTFFHALKKVRNFFGGCKQRAKSTTTGLGREKLLH
jgi:hypothetical protein